MARQGWICIVLISLVLSSCGGGGGGGGGGGNSGNGEVVYSVDYQLEPYTGIDTAATLSIHNYADYIDLVFGSLAQDVLGSVNNTASQDTTSAGLVSGIISIDESDACINGGRIIYNGNLDDHGLGVLTVHYQNCEIEGLIYDGQGYFDIDRADIALGEISDAMLIFERLTVSGSSTIIISGTIRNVINPFVNGATCYGGEKFIYNVLLENEAISEQVYFSDLSYNNYFCNFDRYYEYEEISGRIYHHLYGYVDVSTTSPLRYDDPIFTEPYTPYPDKEGSILFTGSNGATVRLSATSLIVDQHSFLGVKEYLNTIELDLDSDSLYEYRATMDPDTFVLGAWKDIDDTDGDGMPNSWETLYGLSETNPADALLDSDGDGFSNYVEYLYYGDPTDSAHVPIAADLIFDVRTPGTETRAGREMAVNVSVPNPNPVYRADDVVVTITKSTNASWTDIGHCSINIGDPNSITCLDRGVVLGITTDEPGNVSLSGTVTSTTYDPDTTNNSFATEMTFAQRQANIGISADSSFYNDVAVVGRSHTTKFDITQWGPDDARDAVFTFNIPPGINVESAEYTVYPGLNGFPGAIGTCAITSQVTCNMGTLQFNAASYKGEILITLSGVSEGMTSFTTSLTSTAIETQPVDNVFTSDMFVGSPLTSYQLAIDNAVAPSTISIPAGYYVGTLDFKGKDIRVEGGAGHSTVIWTSSPFASIDMTRPWIELGPNGSFSGIKLLTSATAISVLGENAIIENTILEQGKVNASNVVGVRVYGEASGAIIRNNIFRNIQSGGCRLIDSLFARTVIIENNLFHDNPDCVAVKLDDPGVANGEIANKTVINNTFVNNSMAIYITQHNIDGNQLIQNNIFHSNEKALVTFEPLLEPSSTITLDDPTLVNNIFSGNVSDYEYTPLVGFKEIRPITGNITDAPSFVEPTNGNFHLQSTSVGIDDGENVDAPTTDLDGVSRPQDGNSDGVADVDIGAYEYVP